MEGKRLLRSLRLANFLSYGPEGTEIELEPLNVLIGPNGSGKSNLIEAISLLKALPSDVSVPFRSGGGIPEWMWKGERSKSDAAPDIQIDTVVSHPKEEGDLPLCHSVRFASVAQQVKLMGEGIVNEGHEGRESAQGTLFGPGPPLEFCHRDQDGFCRLNMRESASEARTPWERRRRDVRRSDLSPQQSILSQVKDADQYPEITYLGHVFSQVYIFRGMNLAHGSPLRGPQRADEPSSFLSQDGSNLGMVLNDLLNQPQTKKRLLTELKRFYEPVEDITTRIHAGTVETFFHERDFTQSVPSIRLSDGTLRYLCLLTILCHPTPPPLVCIEDPELGLHPDVLPIVAELLKEASQRMQLIVTTHSDELVSALSDVPAAVIVCERDEDGTRLERLQPDSLKQWLDKYSLGELWRMGEVGGNP